MVESILQLGADPNIKSISGMTALNYAIAIGVAPPEVIEDLLKAGARIDIANEYGNTAFDYAIGLPDGERRNSILKLIQEKWPHEFEQLNERRFDKRTQITWDDFVSDGGGWNNLVSPSDIEVGEWVMLRDSEKRWRVNKVDGENVILSRPEHDGKGADNLTQTIKMSEVYRVKEVINAFLWFIGHGKAISDGRVKVSDDGRVITLTPSSLSISILSEDGEEEVRIPRQKITFTAGD